MRLGQLARQLETKPEKIASFLAKEKNITINEHPNCKVQDELIEDITNYFKPVVKQVEVVAEKSVKTKEKEVVTEELEEKKTDPVEHIEIQKVTKPQELKIIGKIDLPNRKNVSVEVDGVVYNQEELNEKKRADLKADREKKALEKEAKKKAEEEKRKLAKEKRAIETERKVMLAAEKSNKLSREAEEKKAAILKVQKEREIKLEKKRKAKQTKHYTKKHSAKAINKKNKKEDSSKIKKEVIRREVNQEILQPVVEVEKSIYKRFIKWLNT